MPGNPEIGHFNTEPLSDVLQPDERHLCAESGGKRMIWESNPLPDGQGHLVESGCSVVGCLKMYLDRVTENGRHAEPVDDWNSCLADE